jgi:hypothetical protein
MNADECGFGSEFEHGGHGERREKEKIFGMDLRAAENSVGATRRTTRRAACAAFTALFFIAAHSRLLIVASAK